MYSSKDGMTQAPVIEVRNVSFSYQATPVLEDVNLTIYDRESVCMVGPNGGGKTTLLRLLLGQLQPTQGEILIFGQPPEQARLRMGYMPQRSRVRSALPGDGDGRGADGTAGPARAARVAGLVRPQRPRARPARPWSRSTWPTRPPGRSPPFRRSAAAGADRPGPVLPARVAALGRADGQRRFAGRGPARSTSFASLASG